MALFVDLAQLSQVSGSCRIIGWPLPNVVLVELRRYTGIAPLLALREDGRDLLLEHRALVSQLRLLSLCAAATCRARRRQLLFREMLLQLGGQQIAQFVVLLILIFFVDLVGRGDRVVEVEVLNLRSLLVYQRGRLAGHVLVRVGAVVVDLPLYGLRDVLDGMRLRGVRLVVAKDHGLLVGGV